MKLNKHMVITNETINREKAKTGIRHMKYIFKVER
jgi:hypothetical protein